MITRSKFLWIQNAALALIVLFVSFWVSNPLFNKGVTGKNTYHFTVENASEGKIYLKTALFMADRHHLALEGSGHLLASGELIEIGTTDNALPNGFEYEWLDIATGKYYVWEAPSAVGGDHPSGLRGWERMSPWRCACSPRSR